MNFFNRSARQGVVMAVAALAFAGGMRIAAASGPQAPGQPATQVAGPRIALVIGNNDYREFPKLVAAVSDADAVAQALTARGFRVTKATDVKREAMLSLIAQFEQSLSTQGGVGVFYFSGQALHAAGEDIMFPVDARLSQGVSVLKEGIPLAKIQGEIKSRTGRAWQDNGIVTVYAASRGQSAFDRLPGQENSPFVLGLVSALQAPGADIQGVFQRVRDGVEQAFRDPKLKDFKQTPDISGQLRAPFFFSLADRDPVGSVSRILLLDASRDNPYAGKPHRQP